MDKVIVSQEVWADEKGKPVPYGDSRGRTVLFGQGQQITGEEAKKYHIGEDGRYDEPGSRGESRIKDEPVVKAKAVSAAPLNKAVEMAPSTK